MLYIVIESYQAPSEPMSYDDALALVMSIRATGGSAHIEHYNFTVLLGNFKNA